MPSQRLKSNGKDDGLSLICPLGDKTQIVFLGVEAYWKFVKTPERLISLPRAEFKEGEPDG